MFWEKKEKNNTIYIVIISLLVVISILSFFLGKKLWSSGNTDNVTTNDTLTSSLDKENPNEVVKTPNDEVTNSGSDENPTNGDNGKDVKIKVISDKRCEYCNADELIKSLKQDPSISGAKYEIKDFSDEWIEKYFKDNELALLPVIILSTDDIEDSWQNGVKNFLEKMETWEYKIKMQGVFDPYAEICDNKIDDDKNGKIDCEDEGCSKEISCSKVDKPKAELFIMSYCPYWLQAQKWYIEVMEKMKDVADVSIRFVPYLMHWPSEWEENIVQHCIQKEQNDKYIPYLKCFLKEKWKEEECRKEVSVDDTKLQACITTTKKDIDYDAKLANAWTWYPEFNIDDQEAKEYGVQWSPSFVINWIKVDSWRSAKAYADIICSTFKEKPEVCNEEFTSTSYDPSFWFTSWWQNVEAACWN